MIPSLPTVAAASLCAPTRLIVGCGALGMRVAARWVADTSCVYGITRTHAKASQLAAVGIRPIVSDVTDTIIRDLPEVDTVFWSVGFDHTASATYREVHVEGLARVLGALPGRPRLILCSSTGVWGDEGGRIVNEQTPALPTREAGRVLLEAERLVHDQKHCAGTSLRFAGLYGPGRLPRLEDLKAGRAIAADPESWLNLIHLDDAARVVVAIASHPAPRELYVVSDGVPVRRREWYGRLAALSGSPEPTWDVTLPRARGADKRVDPALLFHDLGMTLDYPDSLQGLAAILKEVGNQSVVRATR